MYMPKVPPKNNFAISYEWHQIALLDYLDFVYVLLPTVKMLNIIYFMTYF